MQYSLEKLRQVLNRDVFWLLRQCEDALNKKLKYDDKNMDELSYITFIRWFNKTYTDQVELPKTSKRKFSTTHRIEIAYRTKWKCGMCEQVLKPNFECDHIVALHRGGKDEFENCWALCSGCHSDKSRAERLKHDKFLAANYTQKLDNIELTAFEKFKHVKKSKYF